MKWSAEAREKVATMLREKKTAKEIGDFFNVTRSAITGLIARDIGLCAIEDRRRGKSTAGGKVKRRTAEEIRQWRREYNRAYAAQRRENAKKTGTVIPFPIKTRRSPEKPVAQQPKLTVVSNNIDLMVKDWLAKNGGPRRFADNDTTGDVFVAEYLRERGVIVARTRMDWGSAAGRWKMSRGQGRPKMVSYAEILRVADEFRVAEGLQPFAPPTRHQEHLRRVR